MPNINYDSEVKTLSIKLRNKKSVDSDIKDNVVLDYDENGHIVNIDIMDIQIEDLVKSTSPLYQRDDNAMRSGVIAEKRAKYEVKKKIKK